MGQTPELSVVVPAYNEAGALPAFHAALTAVLRGLRVTYEVVFVDDGSDDGTAAVLAGLQREDPAVSVVELSRNFGQQAALSAGLELSRGAAVVTMDADLQHDPAVLPEMVRLWRGGAAVVNAVRRDDPGAGAAKRVTSLLFYRLMSLLSDTPITADSPDFRLLDRKAVDALCSMRESHRFLRGMVGWLGFRQATVPFSPRARQGGAPGYTWGRMLRFAMDGIVSFSIRPLRLALWLGLAVLGLTTCYGLYVLVLLFVDAALVKGWTSLVVMVMFLGAGQLVLLGIIGEYIGRIYEQVKGRPLYVVSEVRAGRRPG